MADLLLNEDDAMLRELNATALEFEEFRVQRSGDGEGASHWRGGWRAGGARPDFRDSGPLVALGLTRREAETLLWVAQGKANAGVALILGVSEATLKRHMGVLSKLGVEKRGASSLIAIEALSR